MVELAHWPIKTTIRADWFYPVLIIAGGAILRLAFFSGGLGTDEIVYLSQAHHLLNGDFNPAGYLGAIRYGINAFQALSLRLFGNGVVGAAGLYFACSLANILLTYGFAYHLWGRRAAIWASLALAVVPIDVTLAGSLNPDPYLSLTISASIIAFYFAEQENRAGLYLSAGLLAGWVFWIKEEVLVFGLLFLYFVWPQRRWRAGWLWFLLGGLICVAGDLGFFWLVYGDPLYQYGIVHKDVGNWLGTQPIRDSVPWAYLRYLFVNIYHTGMLGWLALAGGLLMLRRRSEPARRFVLGWTIGLLLIFSILPISLSPLTFIRKQANYMDIFALPLALLAGWFMAQQQRRTALFLGGAMALTGITLSGLEQQVMRVVTVNGRAAASFAQAHPGTPVFGPLTAQRQSMVERLLRGSLDDGRDIRPFADLNRLPLSGASGNDTVAYLIEDPQMQHWPEAAAEVPLSDARHRCLTPIGPLVPSDLGLGRGVVAVLRAVASVFPAPYQTAVLKAIDPLWQVAPAEVYAMTGGCASSAL